MPAFVDDVPLPAGGIVRVNVVAADPVPIVRGGGPTQYSRAVVQRMTFRGNVYFTNADLTQSVVPKITEWTQRRRTLWRVPIDADIRGLSAAQAAIIQSALNGQLDTFERTGELLGARPEAVLPFSPGTPGPARNAPPVENTESETDDETTEDITLTEADDELGSPQRLPRRLFADEIDDEAPSDIAPPEMQPFVDDYETSNSDTVEMSDSELVSPHAPAPSPTNYETSDDEQVNDVLDAVGSIISPAEEEAEAEAAELEGDQFLAAYAPPFEVEEVEEPEPEEDADDLLAEYAVDNVAEAEEDDDLLAERVPDSVVAQQEEAAEDAVVIVPEVVVISDDEPEAVVISDDESSDGEAASDEESYELMNRE